MEFEKIEKEIEITIKLNKDEAHVLRELILFATDFNLEHPYRFTDDENDMADELNKLLEEAGV